MTALTAWMPIGFPCFKNDYTLSATPRFNVAELFFFPAINAFARIAKMIFDVAPAATFKLYRVHRLFLPALRAQNHRPANRGLVLFHVFAAGKKLQILNPVVVLVLVYVVDNFSGLEIPPDFFFHGKDVFGYILPVLACSWVARGPDENIVSVSRSASLPVGELALAHSDANANLIPLSLTIPLAGFGHSFFSFFGVFHKVTAYKNELKGSTL